MNKLVKLIAITLAVIFFGYFIYAQVQESAKFSEQLEEIQSVRKALEDSVKVLKVRTDMRDLELRDLIKRDMEIIDTLNLTLSRLNRSSKAIEDKIEQNKKIIATLWGSNQ